MKRIGLIGLGRWGMNYFRIFNELPNSSVSYCCDLVEESFEKIKSKNKGVKVTSDSKELFGSKEVDAVVISSPPSTHYKLIKGALNNDKDVLVEKPFVLSSKEAEDVIRLSEETGRLLMVAHTFLYNPCVTKLKEYFSTGFLGRIHYLYFTRTCLGPIRNDVNAMWDLAPHDLSILLHLVEKMPKEVVTVGQSYLRNGMEDVVFITYKFSGKIIANIHVSWLDPFKIRKVTIVGNEKMVVFNDVDRTEPIKIFNKGVERYSEKAYGEFGEFQLAIRDGDVVIPKIEIAEPLKNQCAHFLDCIERKTIPLTSAKESLKTILLLEAAQKSLKTGKTVAIK